MVLLGILFVIAVVMLLWLLEVKLGSMTVMGKDAGARVTGPLFSMSASGSIGKAITYGTWKGRPWCRVWFKPHNPKTDTQVNIRTALALLVAYWRTLNAPTKLMWDQFASAYNMSGFNQVVSRGMKAYVADPGIAVVPTDVTVANAPPDDVWTWNAV